MNTRLIDYAEQQFVGYKHAKSGFSLVELADNMDLKPEEWEAIKGRKLHHLDPKEISELDEFIKAKE